MRQELHHEARPELVSADGIRRWLLILAVLAAVSLVLPSDAGGAPQSPEGLTVSGLEERVDGYRSDLVELMERLGIPGLSVAVARNGRIVWSEGLGWADTAAHRRARAETPYRIASITKTMTATVLLGLHEKGELVLDAPAAPLLGDGPAWTGSVTVRQVLTHTSESDPPGTAFAYSGRYDVLSRVAEEASGHPFPELLVETVLDPASMTRSYPVARSSSRRADEIRRGLATGHLPNGEPAPDGVIPDHTVGGNGVVSTAPDLVRFVHALNEGEILDPATVREMWSPAVTAAGDPLPYGLGWWVEETPALRMVYHGGQWPTYSGLLLHDRTNDLTLAILANHQAVSSPFYGIGTGTALYSTFAAAFLRRFALDPVWEGPAPELPWDAPADSLAGVLESRPPGTARLHLSAELFGRGLVARAAGRGARGDSLLRAVMDCCPETLALSEDLGVLFHLGRSGDPELRRLGQEAGRRRLEAFPEDHTTRFNLAVSYVQSGEGEEAKSILRGLLDDDDVPTWMWSWSAYLLAEQVADERPGEARRLLGRVLEEGVDEGGLFEQIRALLGDLSGR